MPMSLAASARRSQAWPVVAAAAVAGGLTVVLAVASAVLGVVDGVRPAVSGLAGATFGVTGAVLAVRRSGLVVGWLLIAAGLSYGLSTFLHDWARHTLISAPGSLLGGGLALWVGSWLWVFGYCIAAALLPLRLPDGGRPPGAWRVAWWASVAVTVLAAVAWAITPYDRMDRPPLGGLPPGTESPVGTALGPTLLTVSLPLLALCALAALASVVVRLRAAVGEERQQLKWVAYGGVLTIVLLATGQVVGPEGGSDLLLGLAVLPLPLGIAVAALRYRLWDVDLLINGTLVYGLLTALVVGLYAGGVLLLGDVLGERTGAPLLATVVVALTAEPARRRLQRLVDRLTRGDRSDPYRALVRLGRRLETAAAEPVGTEALMGTAEAVRHALQLPWVTVEVREGPVATSGTVVGEGVRVPLVHAGERVGELVAGPRRPGTSLSPGDLRLLDDLARHVAVAAHAAQLREALQRSRERLVMAREEERRRLRHDLHDDLGPVLAAVALQLGEVRSLVGQHPAAPLAERAEGLVTGAVGTVRRIVDGLRPAALDELGLAEALHTLAEGFAAGGLDVTVEVRGDMKSLPAAVEVAALRVATEALSNAVRHSGALRVRLGVERLPLALEVTVADDGHGLTEDRIAGVGLTSMRERAEELGGTCTVTSGPAGGTVVMASLPVAAPVEDPVSSGVPT